MIVSAPHEEVFPLQCLLMVQHCHSVHESQVLAVFVRCMPAIQETGLQVQSVKEKETCLKVQSVKEKETCLQVQSVNEKVKETCLKVQSVKEKETCLQLQSVKEKETCLRFSL